MNQNNIVEITLYVKKKNPIPVFLTLFKNKKSKRHFKIAKIKKKTR